MEYIGHLSKDKKLKLLIETHGPFKLKKEKNICLFLCYSIMSQQLSTKVVKVFHQRFIDLFSGKEPTAHQIASTKFETLRAIGLSNAKASYVLNVANFEIEKGMGNTILGKMSNEEVIAYLTEIKGVGRWTVEMLLMFALGREDVFSPDDLGIQTAMIKIYKMNYQDKKELLSKMKKKAEKWAPYRTFACLYLWRYKDVK
ncbi:MAG: DNA-3-methyladenine glycosylase family protein [Chitinophagales bacterium]